MALHASGCGPTHTPQASGASGTNHTQYTRSIARASTRPEAEDVSWAAWRLARLAGQYSNTDSWAAWRASPWPEAGAVS